MLLKTAFFFSSLLSINFVLEVKSDKSEIENNRFELDHRGHVVRDNRPRDQNTRQDETLTTPEQQQDLNTINRIENFITLNRRYLQEARELLPEDYNVAEILTENQLYSNVQSIRNTIAQQRTTGPPVTQEQLTASRQLLIQSLTAYNDQLVRCLSRYSAIQRKRLEDDNKHFEDLLNEMMQREQLQRSQELPARDQNLQKKRQEDYKLLASLEGNIRSEIERHREKLAQQSLLFRTQKISNILSFRILWNTYINLLASIVQRRIVEDIAINKERELAARRQNGNGDKRKFN